MGRIQLVLLSMVVVIALAFPGAAPINAQAANLIIEPGFENAGANWDGCGESEIVDIQQPGVDDTLAFRGRYAGRVAYVSDKDCGFYTTDPIGTLSTSFAIPADATHLTVSFRYRRVGTNIFPMQIVVGESWTYSGKNIRLPNVDADNLPGWNFYRAELSQEDLNSIRQSSQPTSIYFGVFAISGTSFEDPHPPVGTPGFYIDDLRISTAIERTVESPLPAALRSDGTAPIVYISGHLGGVARMNTDGSSPRLVTAGTTSSPLSPVWSSDGRSIARIENSINPANSTDLQVNPAFNSIVYLSDSRGTGVREIYRTLGAPGFEPIPPTLDTKAWPAQDMKIISADFSPNNTALAMTICTKKRWRSGVADDPVCYMVVHDIATNKEIKTHDTLAFPNWGRNGLILAEDNSPYGTREDGIWSYDGQKEQLLIPGTGSLARTSLRIERFPTWSPDGTRFATIRDVSGSHYDEALEGTVYHKAIHLYSRDGQNGSMLLLIDHGSINGGLTWSPNGKYLLYSLIQGEATNIWWLEVATGKTGRMTRDGFSIAPDWRPVQAPDISVVYVPLVVRR